jgi:hypothetical protein
MLLTVASVIGTGPGPEATGPTLNNMNHSTPVVTKTRFPRALRMVTSPLPS